MEITSVYNILGKELRSRQSARILMNKIKYSNALDFKNVVFMSRSFADELYNIRLDFPCVGFLNMSSDLQQMFKVVCLGRQTQRIRKEDNSEIKDINGMDELQRFFNEM